MPREPEVESSAYGADGSTSQPITEQYQLSSTQQPATSSQPAHQYQTHLQQQYQTTTHHVTHPAAAATAAAGTSTHLPAASPAEHTMAATRQQVDTSVPGAHYHHPSSSIEQPTTSNGIPATSQRHEDLPAHYYEDIDSDNDDVADSSRGPVMCKTIVLTAHGGLDKLQVEERARREPSNGEVLVKVGTCLSVCLSVCLFVCLSGCLPVYQTVCHFDRKWKFWSKSVPVCRSVFLPSCLFVGMCLCVSVSVCLCMPVYLSVCLFAHLSTNTCLRLCHRTPPG